jgi:hypothetical protein
LNYWGLGGWDFEIPRQEGLSASDG